MYSIGNDVAVFDIVVTFAHRWSYHLVISLHHLLHGHCDIVIIVVVSTVISTFLPSIIVLVFIQDERSYHCYLYTSLQLICPTIVRHCALFSFTLSWSCVVELHVELHNIHIVVVMMFSPCVCLLLLIIVDRFNIVISGILNPRISVAYFLVKTWKEYLKHLTSSVNDINFVVLNCEVSDAFNIVFVMIIESGSQHFPPLDRCSCLYIQEIVLDFIQEIETL
jgi:hypothetical protein